MLNRRDFSFALTSAAALAASSSSHAQGATPSEGKDYVKLEQPVTVAAPTGKIEVLEFFWYGCPHCNALEPALEAWLAKLPADAAFRRVPVGFSPTHELHQRTFYALEAMGQLEAVHRKLFAAIHVQHRMLNKEPELIEFIGSLGLDKARFADMLKSFGVMGKARAAKQTTAAYRIDGVPSLGIHGRYYTSAALAGGPERAFAVADWLIQQARKTAR